MTRPLSTTVVAAALAAVITAPGCAWLRPACEPLRVPVYVEVVKPVVQPIPDELLEPHPEYTGPLRDCPDIAQSNLDELRSCNADKLLIQDRNRVN